MTDSKNGLYILMISVHGLIRGTHLELGVNSDTGGQITYVLELTKALAQHQQIAQVDLVTRKIVDPKFSPDYAQEEEKLDDNARIIRVSCGPDRYIRKELLWAHLDHFVDNCLHFLCQQDRLPDLIHTHYADAGYVGQQLSQLLGIPQVHTGHSLGRVKRDRLLAKGLKKETLEKRYNFEQRIQVEENLLSRVSMVITSTRQEIIDQYGLYKTKENCKYCVIQPGTDTTRFDFARRKQIDYRIFEKIDQSLAVPKKPMILAICRPEPHKNILGLISAYAGDSRLKNMANLVIVSGTRDDVTQLEPQQKKVWIDILCLIDKYDLWGKVSIPKYHTHEDLPIFYQCALHRRGVFVNPAFSEPFGLTLIESAASGLPFVATENGGPTDIVANLRAGLLVNPTDSRSIADGLRQILSDKRLWLQFSRRGILGVKKHYNWTAHVNKYVKEISSLLRSERKRWRRHRHFLQQVGGALPLAKRALISDIDGTLIGDRLALKKLLAQLEEHKSDTIMGVATGRHIESVVEILKEWGAPVPGVIVSSVGTEIYYGQDLIPDNGWANHIHHLWYRDQIKALLDELPGLVLQEDICQRKFKLSYYADVDKMPSPKEIFKILRANKLRANVIFSAKQFLDILPIRASKGHAIRYLSYKWGIPLDNFIVAGDTENDFEMLKGGASAIVVGNGDSNLKERVKELPRVYVARAPFAKGILEGIAHYHFFDKES